MGKRGGKPKPIAVAGKPAPRAVAMKPMLYEECGNGPAAMVAAGYEHRSPNCVVAAEAPRWVVVATCEAAATSNGGQRTERTGECVQATQRKHVTDPELADIADLLVEDCYEGVVQQVISHLDYTWAPEDGVFEALASLRGVIATNANVKAAAQQLVNVVMLECLQQLQQQREQHQMEEQCEAALVEQQVQAAARVREVAMEECEAALVGAAS